MKPRSRSLGRRRVLVVLTIATVIAIAAQTGHARRFDEVPMNFGPLGLEPDRGYFSQFSWENIDLVNGNLLLNFPIVDLAGDAGMDLKVECRYNWAAGYTWRCGLAGVPIAVGSANGNELHYGWDAEGNYWEELFRPGTAGYE
jgi:hypothetical protein